MDFAVQCGLEPVEYLTITMSIFRHFLVSAPTVKEDTIKSGARTRGIKLERSLIRQNFSLLQIGLSDCAVYGKYNPAAKTRRISGLAWTSAIVAMPKRHISVNVSILTIKKARFPGSGLF